MDAETSDLGYVEKIDAAVDAAFQGVLTDYHRVLGERIAHFLGIWIHEDCLEDVLADIKYARGTVNDLIQVDEERKRYQ
jgi:hypothetical protein